MKRYLALIVVVFLLLLLNFTYGHAYLIAKDCDIAYIAKNCSAIGNYERKNIADHITYDHDAGGGLYIFDHVQGKSSPGDFEAAFRPILTEPLCFAIVGCLIPPTLGTACKQ